MEKIKMQAPTEGATINFITDIVTYGAIDYSFTDHSEGVKVDFDYLCSKLDSDTMANLTDKIKDLVTDALMEIDEENYNEDEE